jgi:hypothetical protein
MSIREQRCSDFRAARKRLRIPLRSLAALLIVSALTLIVVSPATARAPAACKLLTRSLAEDYFNTDMSKTTGVHQRCEWGSRIADLHRAASLTLITWGNPINARQFLNCTSSRTNRVKKVSLPGADEACAKAGYTGICFDKPTGRECIWAVIVDFRRGGVDGEVQTTAPKGYTLNSITHAVRLTRRVLARWH